ncbi:hypothetical protein NMY22_g15261 [Coprinellus aureogranulatus]|nr:hypothetical protein NMY22_g15261 [Coprinellus aureogranulatus]
MDNTPRIERDPATDVPPDFESDMFKAVFQGSVTDEKTLEDIIDDAKKAWEEQQKRRKEQWEQQCKDDREKEAQREQEKEKEGGLTLREESHGGSDGERTSEHIVDRVVGWVGKRP